jgi:hypothetical protein
VTAHGIRHGAAKALAAAHLRLQPEVDLHAIEPGFPSRMEVPEDIDITRLIANFGVATNAIVVIVNVDQVIKDTPRGQVLLVCFLCKILSE